MRCVYHILEKLPDGKLLRVESVESLEEARMRFRCLSMHSRRQYLVYDPARGREVSLSTPIDVYLPKALARP